MSRRTITTKLDEVVAERRMTLKSDLENADSVSVTVDIWSDRQMRGFFGVTVHWLMTSADDSLSLKSALLACSRFKGSHTGERICEEFQQVCEDFKLRKKLDHIICDNAANMKKAFTTCFPGQEEEEDLDDADMWNDLSPEDQKRVDLFIMAKSECRMQCFAQTLQLVVRDGLKETRIVGAAIAKASRLSHILHTSCSFKEMFECEFGQRGIPACIATRWNSTFRQLKVVLNCDQLKLSRLLSDSGHKDTVFTAREWNQMKELVHILQPFAEATDLTQGEKKVTISAVVPCILSLNHHLENEKGNMCYMGGSICSLQTSLQRRFRGVFVNVRMVQESCDLQSVPFSDPLYLKAALLDPSFGTMWLPHDVLVPENTKEAVSMMIKGM